MHALNCVCSSGGSVRKAQNLHAVYNFQNGTTFGATSRRRSRQSRFETWELGDTFKDLRFLAIPGRCAFLGQGTLVECAARAFRRSDAFTNDQNRETFVNNRSSYLIRVELLSYARNATRPKPHRPVKVRCHANSCSTTRQTHRYRRHVHHRRRPKATSPRNRYPRHSLSVAVASYAARHVRWKHVAPCLSRVSQRHKQTSST